MAGFWDEKCPKCHGEDTEGCPMCGGSGKESPVEAAQRIKNCFAGLGKDGISPDSIRILIEACEELERRANNNLELARHVSSGELAF